VKGDVTALLTLERSGVTSFRDISIPPGRLVPMVTKQYGIGGVNDLCSQCDVQQRENCV
jgi:hypothetical protein